MSDLTSHVSNLPREQEAIRAKCFHPSGTFAEFPKEAIEQSIPQRLGSLAQRFGAQVAITSPSDEPMTYARLFEVISSLVNALNLLGVGRGNKVAVVLPDGPKMAVTFLGIASSATCAPLNPGFRVQEFVSLFDDLRPKALVVESDADSAAVAAAQIKSIPIVRLSAVNRNETNEYLLRGETLSPVIRSGFASASDVALILFTSGTTARPKLVPLTHANLLASASNIAATLELSPNDRCLNIMPLYHIHGLVGGLLAPLIAGGSVCPSGFDARQFFDWLSEFQPTWYTAVPTMHQAILAQAHAHLETIRRYPLRFIRSSSSPLPGRVMEELETAFNTPVIESYGMTEAAHQMASNPLPPAERKLGSVGKTAGPEIAIMDDKSNLQPAGTTGEVVIRGANVMGGYVDGSDANATAFTQGWFRTGDQGYLDGDGYLFLAGRIKELINRGGEKISPREIDDVLLAHPAVEQAVAFGVPHSTLGEEVAAVVVLRPQTQATVRELREFVAYRLADFKVPKQIAIVDEIPKSATGKLQRGDLAERFARQLNVEAISPETQLESMVAEIYADVLGVEQVSATDNFFALGGDSLRATQVIARIRAMLDVNLSIATIFRRSTVRELAHDILRVIAATDDDSVNTHGKST